MTSFSEQLKNEVEPIWRRIFDHPFLKEIKDGTLPEETFRQYLIQDYLYLEGFGRTVALALAKAPDSQTFQDLALRVMTPVERPLHQKLFAAAGLSIADAENSVQSPANKAYVDHMLQTASLHGLGPTAAALLPCPWTYHLLKDEVGQSEHPLYGQWTRFYVEGLLEGSVEAWRGFVDKTAKRAGKLELEAMRQAFLSSSRYEYMFWDAAYNRQQWPV
ncbi:MAG: thiaminase II [SAR202 cluster bacterium]|nr:thiaminase II [SAR202 cluster bacterium]